MPGEIDNYLRQKIGLFAGSVDMKKRLRKQAQKLSADFAKEKFSEAMNELPYFFYNFPMNLMKANAVARYIFTQHRWNTNQRQELNILDLGCGEGAGMLGALYALNAPARINLTGVDKSKAMIRSCRWIMKEIETNRTSIASRLVSSDIEDYLGHNTGNNFDMIIMSNSLLEIHPHRTPLSFIKKLINRLEATGVLMFIEPALKTSFRRLTQLRTQIIERSNMHILLPCLHEQSCPLATMPSQWCHQSIRWRPPEYLESLNKGLNREIDMLKFSLLVVGPESMQQEKGHRVISTLLKEKGKTRCYICAPAKRIELVRLDRDISEKNQGFDAIRKGDVVEITPMIEQNPSLCKIAKSTRVRIINRISIQEDDFFSQ